MSAGTETYECVLLANNRITLSKEFCDALGWGLGTKLCQWIESGRICMKEWSGPESRA